MRPSRLLSAALLGVLATSLAHAQDQSLPPRSEWHASASSLPQAGREPERAIDGDQTTEWGGDFSPGQWLQVDLGRPAAIGGVLIHWDVAFSSIYLIQSSIDGEHWDTAYQTSDSPGGMDYVFFTPVRARYLRLTSAPSTVDWGVSVFEFQPMAARDSPRIAGLAKGLSTKSLWSGENASPLASPRAGGTGQLDVTLPQPLSLTGLEVFWESAREDARLEGRDISGQWHFLSRDPGPFGDHSYLAASRTQALTELRLRVITPPGQRPVIRRLRLLSATQAMTTMKRYEIVASRGYHELFPSSLHGEQVYWTAVGVPAGERKSLFDEYGDLEPVKDGPLIQPLWRDASGHAAAAFGAPREHTLRDNWMPMPAVEWSPRPGLTLRSEAFAAEGRAGPVTLVRHRLENSGKSVIDGQLVVIVRPMQVNPPWQHGGLSPIRSIALGGSATRASVIVNGKALLTSLTATAAAGVAPFGSYGEHELTQLAADGRVPQATSAHDDAGLAAAALLYRVHLAPGAHRDVVLSVPLGGDASQGAPRADPLTSDADFDKLAERIAAEWDLQLGRVDLVLPDESIVNTLRAQLGYMLVNEKDLALEAGPRNYDRSFIRDGSATAVALLRMGASGVARAYLDWYAEHALHPNGLVSPILNDDGSINRGVGSDLEYDSQGEFVYLVAAVARLDGGAASVRNHQPQVRAALGYLERLRERTLVPGYMAASTSDPERFRGIIAPSISHEGYPRPTHSYWDDYWALKGWEDGIWLAREWGDEEMAAWAVGQYAALRKSFADSVRSTMQWRHIDYIPASADLGDDDPTSLSIGLDPCGQEDLLPFTPLMTTFTRYRDEVRTRELPGARYAYTPYEFRNVLSFVRLNRPQDADHLLTWLRTGRHPAGWEVFAEVVRSQTRAPFYLGDMPHTWVGAEYVRAVIGMLMHEDEDGLELLPGVPPAWVQGQLSVRHLPTAFGTLSMSARQEDGLLRLTLEPGLGSRTALWVSWPTRERPIDVTVDGKLRTDFTSDGIRLEQPFSELLARWKSR
jgi:hypothetical protein